MEALSTGETWFGREGQRLGLNDDMQSIDRVIRDIGTTAEDRSASAVRRGRAARARLDIA